MMQIVVTSAEELKAIIRDVLSEQTEPTVTGVQSDNINLSRAIQLLNELGYPTSKAKIYKLTYRCNALSKIWKQAHLFMRGAVKMGRYPNQTKSA